MGTDHQDGEMQQQGSRYGQLVLSAAGQPLRTYWLTQTRTVIGRRATNTLVLDDLTVSGEHAVLMAGQQDVVIQDLGSRNGTLVNGAPVARALLNDGDSIDIGIYRLVYRRAGTIGPTDAHEQGAPSGNAQPPDASGHDASSRDASVSDTFPPLSMGIRPSCWTGWRRTFHFSRHRGRPTPRPPCRRSIRRPCRCLALRIHGRAAHPR